MDNIANVGKCAEAIAKHYDADVWFYSGPINDAGLGEIISSFDQDGRRPNAILTLVTNGGSANAGYQIARLFQKNYKKFIIHIPSYCKSAGTIIALGAHELLMDVFSELGPLDVQLTKQNEIAVDKSGLLSGSAFSALAEASFDLFEEFLLKITLSSGGQISFKVAAELSAGMTQGLMAGIYSQLNPDIIGSDYRDLNVALHYGKRLARHSGNASIETVINLVKGYPSHDFIIDDEEASNLFKRVEEPHDLIYILMSALGNYAYSEAPQPIVFNLTSKEEDQDDEEPIDADDHTSGGEKTENDGMDEGQEADRGGDTEPGGASPEVAAADAPTSSEESGPKGDE